MPCINRFGNAVAFIEAWDADAASASGAPGVFPHQWIPCYETPRNSSAILTPNHTAFLSAIEPGVRNLVTWLVFRARWVTYSSCEGHPSTIVQPAALRHVGLLPRDPDEQYRIRSLLYRAAADTNAMVENEAVRITVLDHTVTNDDESRYPAIDIIFRQVGEERVYFIELEGVTQLFLNAADHHRASISP